MKEQALETAETAVKLAEQLGAEQTEAFVGITRTFSINVENNSIKSASEKLDAGCGIRCISGKKIGFAFVTTLNKEDLRTTAQNAFSLSRASITDPDFVSLPATSSIYPKIDGLFDSKIADVSPDEAAEIVARLVAATESKLQKFKYAVEAKMSVSSHVVAIVNSLGISASFTSTSGYVYSAPTIKVDATQTSSYDYHLSRTLADLQPELVGESAADAVISSLGGKTVESGIMPVIFHPIAVSTILGVGFAGAINAEEVQFGRSYISDALGDNIASEQLTIVDDALLPGAVGSRPFDAEGAVSRKTSIIEQGILKSLIHNSYTSNKAGVENTGNASRSSYSSLPSISPSNFIIEPDRGTIDDLINELRKGIVCRDTGDRPNMTTGDLSAMVMEGFYFENGEIQFPVKNTLIGINMRDLLKRVIRIGNDVRTTIGAVTPSIAVESARITSG